jgi:hypothetical protein
MKRESFLVEHYDKANALWKCYKDRLGISTASRAQASEGFRSIENKKFPTMTNKNSQDLIYEMQNNE